MTSITTDTTTIEHHTFVVKHNAEGEEVDMHEVILPTTETSVQCDFGDIKN